jgi:hypothetical protein
MRPDGTDPAFVRAQGLGVGLMVVSWLILWLLDATAEIFILVTVVEFVALVAGAIVAMYWVGRHLDE